MTPLGWRVASLGDLVSLVAGSTPKGLTEHLIDGPAPVGSVPFFKVGDMNLDPVYLRDARASISRDAAQKLHMRLVPEGAVVFPKAGGAIATNKKRVVAASGAIDLNCMAAVPGREIDGRFLKLWFESIDLSRLSDGSVLPQLSKRTMANMRVLLPPLEKQRRIVEILEDHLSRLDAAYSLLSTAQARLEIYQASVRDVAVTGGAGRVRVGANLPIGWRWASVEEFAAPTKGSMTIGPFGSNLKVVDYRDFGVPLVFVRNVRTASFGPVGCRYVTPEKAKELRAHRVEPGDVVLTKMGDPPGDAAVYRADVPGVVTADVIRIRPAVGVDPDYLVLALNSGLVRQQIAEITRGVAQQKVSLARYRSEVLVPTPAFDVQAAVATACAEDLAMASRAETALQALEVQLSALKRSLLAAAFSGRLAS